MDDQRWPRLTLNLRNAVRALRDGAERDHHRLFVAEGTNVASTELIPNMVMVRSDATPSDIELAQTLHDHGAEIYQCSVKDMEVMSDTKTPQALLCVIPYLTEQSIGNRVVILDAVSDPGNVGTIIRTAAWFGWTDVILGMGCADLYNAKVIRSTAGAFSAINVLRKRDLATTMPVLLSTHRCIAAVPRDGQSPAQLMNTSEPLAIVIGSEAHGVSEAVEALCQQTTTIPGTGTIESLNAATAAAILCYEGRMSC